MIFSRARNALLGHLDQSLFNFLFEFLVIDRGNRNTGSFLHDDGLLRTAGGTHATADAPLHVCQGNVVPAHCDSVHRATIDAGFTGGATVLIPKGLEAGIYG